MSTELQQLNEQNKAGLWALTDCRMQKQREVQFAEVTPVMAEARNSRIAMRIQTGGMVAESHNGAEPATSRAEYDE